MPQPIDPHVIDRYLAGEASPGEAAEVQALAERDPTWAAAIAALRADYAGRAPGAASRWDADAAWSSVRSRLAAPAAPRGRATGRRPFAAPRWAWLAAAAVLLAVGLVTVWRGANVRRAAAGNATAMREIVTPNGARRTVTLDDGSRVTLNAGSRLRSSRDFGARSRDVYLDGEGYFAVAHDATRPFRVHARGAVAHDLGTRFTVRAYPEMPHLEVVVVEGRVSLRHDRADADSAILDAGQLGRLGDSGAPSVESNVEVERWTAWTGGSLVLDGLTLAEALPQLERWYDAEIRVADPQLGARRVTARFHDETLPQMLDALALALGARWQQSGRTVTLSPTDR